MPNQSWLSTNAFFLKFLTETFWFLAYIGNSIDSNDKPLSGYLTERLEMFFTFRQSSNPSFECPQNRFCYFYSNGSEWETLIRLLRTGKQQLLLRVATKSTEMINEIRLAPI